MKRKWILIAALAAFLYWACTKSTSAGAPRSTATGKVDMDGGFFINGDYVE